MTISKRLFLSFAYVIFVILTIYYILPLFSKITYWGHMDWDQYMFWHEVPRITMLVYKQFPLWNPYGGGGNVLLAHPQSCFLSPFFLFPIIFGTVIGIKIHIVVLFFLGFVGMFNLARYFQISRLGSFLSSIILMLNSTIALHITEGHLEWAMTGLIPWIVLWFLKIESRRKYIILCVVAIVTMYFGVDAYLFVFVLMFLFLMAVGLTITSTRKNACFLKHWLILGIFVFGLSMIKTIPMVEFYKHTPRIKTGIVEKISPQIFGKMLFSREQKKYYEQTTLANRHGSLEGEYLRRGWHEYGAYIGLFVFILMLFGLIGLRKSAVFIPVFVFFCLLVLGDSAKPNVWEMIHSLPFLRGFQLPSRNIIFLILTIATLAGFGFDRFIRMFQCKKFLPKHFGIILGLFLVVYVGADLMLVSRPILEETFTIPPIERDAEQIFSIRNNMLDINQRPSRSDMLSMLRSNIGCFNSYEVMTLNKGYIFLKPWDNNRLNNWYVKVSGHVHSSFHPELGLNQTYFFFDLDKQFSQQESVSFFTSVYSDTLRLVRMAIRKSSGAFSIYLNDNLVYARQDGKTDVPRILENLVLQKGWNTMKISFPSGQNRYLVLSRFFDSNYKVEQHIIYDCARKIFEQPTQDFVKENNTIFIQRPGQIMKRFDFTPNRVSARILMQKDGVVSLNQNYYSGWNVIVKDRGKMVKTMICEYRGLPSVILPKGDYEVCFYYSPTSFKIGVLLTFLSLVSMFFYFLRSAKNKKGCLEKHG